MLMPHTAFHLRERRSNNLRDYVSVASQLAVTHFWLFSATPLAPYLRLATVPQGPTLTFRIASYTPSVHVRATHRRPIVLQNRDLDHPPLLVLNNFAGVDNVTQLIAETFRHSFPPIDVTATKLSALKRVLLVHRDEQSGRVYLRHFALRVQPAGLSRPVRKLVTKRRVPKLAALADVSQLLEEAVPGVFSSDSEMEGGDAFARVTLPQQVKTLRKGASSTVKLVEVGPRMCLELVKAEAGLCEGAVLFHGLVEKSGEDVARDEERAKGKKALKRKRREEQEANVKRKREVKKTKKDRHKKNIEARLAAEKEAEKLERKEKGEGDEEGYEGEVSEGESSESDGSGESGESDE